MYRRTNGASGVEPSRAVALTACGRRQVVWRSSDRYPVTTGWFAKPSCPPFAGGSDRPAPSRDLGRSLENCGGWSLTGRRFFHELVEAREPLGLEFVRPVRIKRGELRQKLVHKVARSVVGVVG